MVLIAVSLAAALVFGLLAFSMTGSTELEVTKRLNRSVYMDPGEYTLNMQGNGSVSVTIYSQNRQDTMMGTQNRVYGGTLTHDTADAVFTVPEDSLVVHFNFQAVENTLLERVHYEGTAVSGDIPLEYKLLPAFVADRLQGLFTANNFVLRTIYFEDGLKLFKQAPIFGLGIGAFESALMSVQEFHYETKYAHNHYIQTLAETGIVGCFLFVALFVVSAIAVLKARRKEDMHPLVPALGAALVFMAGHAAVEVTFSAFDFIPIAFGVFALIELCCGDAIPTPWLSKRIGTGLVAGVAALILIFFGMLCGTMTARQLVTKQATFESLERAAKMDRYEWADYALSYVVSAQDMDDTNIRVKADKFAAKLGKVNSNTIPIYLAEYYFVTDRMDLAFDMVEKGVMFVASKSETWKTAFDVLEYHEKDNPAYRERTLRIYEMMQEWDDANIGTITLPQETMDFITRMGE